MDFGLVFVGVSCFFCIPKLFFLCHPLVPETSGLFLAMGMCWECFLLVH